MYQHTKSQPKIRYIIVLTEMVKYDIIWRFEIMHFFTTLDVRFCYFVQPKIQDISS
jgi:hypothetical protein